MGPDDTSERVKEFKTRVANSLRSRLDLDRPDKAQALSKKAAMISSFLDPRHKHLRFATNEMRAAVRDHVTALMAKLPDSGDGDFGGGGSDVEEAADTAEPGEVVVAEAAPTEKRAKHVDAMIDFFGEDYFAEEAPLSVDDEMKRYLQEDAISPGQEPGLWWELHEKRYKRLSRLARVYLCVPATSVPAERVFSTAGLVLNRLRSRLTPEHVDMLLFLNKNG